MVLPLKSNSKILELSSDTVCKKTDLYFMSETLWCHYGSLYSHINRS